MQFLNQIRGKSASVKGDLWFVGSFRLWVGDLAFSQPLGVLLSGWRSVEDSSELDTDNITDTFLKSLEIVLNFAHLDLFFHHFFFLIFELLPQFLLWNFSWFDSGGEICIDFLHFLYFLVEQVHYMILFLSFAIFLSHFLAKFAELMVFLVDSLLENMDPFLVLSFFL